MGISQISPGLLFVAPRRNVLEGVIFLLSGTEAVTAPVVLLGPGQGKRWATEQKGQMKTGCLGVLFPCLEAGSPWSSSRSTGSGVLLRGALGWGLGGL